MDTKEDGKADAESNVVIIKDSAGNVVCPECKTQFAELRSLQRHLLQPKSDACYKKIGSKVVPHGCLACGRVYATADNLRTHPCSAHKRKQEEQPETTPAKVKKERLEPKCAKCSAFSNHDGNYWRHRATEHGDGFTIS